MAAVIGEMYGIHRLFKKTLEGSLACLISCGLVAIIFTRLAPEVTQTVSIIGAITAAIVEVLPIPWDDNLNIPIVSAGVMTLAISYHG
jgi:dolichol kinase